MKIILSLLMTMAAVCFCGSAYADVDDAPDEVQIVYIECVQPEETPAPKYPVQQTYKYDWPDELIDQLASIYWAETGANGPRTAQEKLMITQCIWNRAHYGGPFPSDLIEVCKQKGEWNHGKISDRNRQAARDNLDKVRSQAEGSWQGIDVNMAMAIYMTREGGSGILTFQDSNWVTIYRVEG